MVAKMKRDAELLAQFTGSEVLYRHPLISNVKYTLGVKYVAEAVGAYWLLDEVVFAQRYEQCLNMEEFRVWALNVSGQVGQLTCDDGNGNVLLQKVIEFTDFPDSRIKFYCTENVILLPSEY